MVLILFFFSRRRRHTWWTGDWSSDVCSSDLPVVDQRHELVALGRREERAGQDQVALGVHEPDQQVVTDRLRVRLVQQIGRASRRERSTIQQVAAPIMKGYGCRSYGHVKIRLA